MHLQPYQSLIQHGQFFKVTCMADTSVVDLNSNFMGFGRCDFDVFDHQLLSCLPCHCGLRSISIESLGRAVGRIDLTLQVIV